MIAKSAGGPILALGIVAASIGAAPSISFGANLVADGDFDSPSGGPLYIEYTAPVLMGPWAVTSGSVDLIGGYWQAPPLGGGSLDLDGASPGAMSETLNLTAGDTYGLSFYLSGNPGVGGVSTKTVNISIGTLNQDYTYTTGSNSFTNMMYVFETTTFVANGNDTLSFDPSSSDFGPVLGNVSVVAVGGSTVPETQTGR